MIKISDIDLNINIKTKIKIVKYLKGYLLRKLTWFCFYLYLFIFTRKKKAKKVHRPRQKLNFLLFFNLMISIFSSQLSLDNIKAHLLYHSNEFNNSPGDGLKIWTPLSQGNEETSLTTKSTSWRFLPFLFEHLKSENLP